MLPGDIVGLFAPLVAEAAHDVSALTDMRLVRFPTRQVLEAFDMSPCLGITLAWLASQDDRILEEQIVRVGRRAAHKRLAHLFVELRRRQTLAGIDADDADRLPLTQEVLADALGMSHVHANRCFRRLSSDGLVKIERGDIHLIDTAALAALADFDPSYLEPEPGPLTRAGGGD